MEKLVKFARLQRCFAISLTHTSLNVEYVLHWAWKYAEKVQQNNAMNGSNSIMTLTTIEWSFIANNGWCLDEWTRSSSSLSSESFHSQFFSNCNQWPNFLTWSVFSQFTRSEVKSLCGCYHDDFLFKAAEKLLELDYYLYTHYPQMVGDHSLNWTSSEEPAFRFPISIRLVGYFRDI